MPAEMGKSFQSMSQDVRAVCAGPVHWLLAGLLRWLFLGMRWLRLISDN